jgi:hypothetical protein
VKALIISGGLFGLGFFIFHIFFWKLFDWKKDLGSLTPINRGVMPVLNLCLMICFLIFAYVSLFHTEELLKNGISIAFFIIF